jgi:hypothetical protein
VLAEWILLFERYRMGWKGLVAIKSLKELSTGIVTGTWFRPFLKSHKAT